MYCKACGNSDQSQFRIYSYRAPICIPCEKRRYQRYYALHKEQYAVHHRQHYIPHPRRLRDEFGNKKCTICKQYLPLSSFSRNIVRWDGLEAYCRDCNVIKVRKWRTENRLRANQFGRESMARYPDRCKARWQANHYYPEGQMCSIKGCVEIGERHHPDYANGKDIIWLCKKHHNLLYHANKTSKV